MSIWNLSQYIESKTPSWVMPLMVLIAVIVGSWLDYNRYRDKSE